jgi:YesN/AraC family two-component response regulator
MKTNPVDFLLKPVSREQLQKVLNKLFNQE